MSVIEEAEKYLCTDTGMVRHYSGVWVHKKDYDALLERLKAAEKAIEASQHFVKTWNYPASDRLQKSLKEYEELK